MRWQTVVFGALQVAAMLVLGTLHLMAWKTAVPSLLLLAVGPAAVARTARKGRRAVFGLVMFVMSLMALGGAARYTDGLVERRAVHAVRDGRSRFRVLWYEFGAGRASMGDRVFRAPNSWYFVVVSEAGGELRAELRD